MGISLPPLDIDAIREMVAKRMNDKEIASILGVHPLRVGRARAKNGIPSGFSPTDPHRRTEFSLRSRKWRKSDELKVEEIRAMAESGMSDPEIASAIKRSFSTVQKFRIANGIPSSRASNPASFLRKIADGLKSRHAGLVVKKMENKAKTNARYGLPSDMTKKQVRIILSLVDGPQTIEGIKSKMGIVSKYKSDVFQTKIAGIHTNALQNLCREGWVFRIAPGGRKGEFSTYMLTMKAIDALSSTEDINE